MTGKEILSGDEVRHVAKLANLAIDEEQVERFAQELSSVLSYVDQLGQLPTEGVEATLGVQPRANVFREDVEAPSLDRHRALANAPASRDDSFEIPRILESTE